MKNLTNLIFFIFFIIALMCCNGRDTKFNSKNNSTKSKVESRIKKKEQFKLDPKKAKEADIVLRVKKIGVAFNKEGMDKLYHWDRAKIVSILKDEYGSENDINRSRIIRLSELEIASNILGLPEEECIVYLTRYNPLETKTISTSRKWMLLNEDGNYGVQK